MPKVALADTFDDWEGLLRSAAPYADIKDLKVHIAELETALHRLHDLEALRADLRAQRQQATRDSGEVRDAGKLAAIQIRSILRGILGHSSERLVQFNMRPRRSRRSKVAPLPVPNNPASSE